jgi:hypothetical protein
LLDMRTDIPAWFWFPYAYYIFFDLSLLVYVCLWL